MYVHTPIVVSQLATDYFFPKAKYKHVNIYMNTCMAIMGGEESGIFLKLKILHEIPDLLSVIRTELCD